ncbi:MAG: Cysteine synthase [Chloroflexi bacterium]|nr:Cysteine synthase [Chloroflexota bacterium]
MIAPTKTIATPSRPTTTPVPGPSPMDMEGMDLLKSVGNTPLLSLRSINGHISPAVHVYAKAEWLNPGGSVKDRPAFNIIRTALFEGKILPGTRLLDSTSGNMGIAYATFGASLDVPVTLVIPENVSPERVAILRALGAELIFTDPMEGSDGAIHAVRKLAKQHPERYYYANQYDNPANWQAHYHATGPEIITQTAGEITHFVAGLGTSGTFMGVSRALREHDPSVKAIAVQPEAAFHGLEGLKHMTTAIQPKIYDPEAPDQILGVATEAAYEMVRRLAREEGYFVGISSGAAAVAALQVAAQLEEGVVVTVFPDAGYKYLSDEALWA